MDDVEKLVEDVARRHGVARKRAQAIATDPYLDIEGAAWTLACANANAIEDLFALLKQLEG